MVQRLSSNVRAKWVPERLPTGDAAQKILQAPGGEADLVDGFGFGFARPRHSDANDNRVSAIKIPTRNFFRDFGYLFSGQNGRPQAAASAFA